MDFHVLIMRLSPFRDVTRSITHQFLYGECSQVLDSSCIDFVFFPTAGERQRHSELKGFYSHRKVADFDLILISNSYAVELLNLPYMLKQAGIPCSSEERSLLNTKPLLIMGGSNALAAQSILYSDSNAMTDALYIGEGERNVERIVRELSSVPSGQRRQKLSTLQSVITGLKVFGAPDSRIKKAVFADMESKLQGETQQALFDSSEAATARLQISYDCPAFCTFCFEGWERKPYREVPLDRLVTAAENLKKEMGADTLEIAAFNFNTHTDIVSIIKEMNKLFFHVNFMSQRADILAAMPRLADYETAAGKSQYTLGIEGISDRLRSYFNKNLDRQTALTAITQLLKEPVREIKFFFILSGLENEQDVTEFREFLAAITALREQYNTGVRMLCSFGLLVRMPFTPLRYEKLLLTEKDWHTVVEQIKQAVTTAGYEFRLACPYDEYFLSQVLVMTNRYLAPVLEKMADHGYIYDQTLHPEAWPFFKSQIPIDEAFTAEKSENWHFAFDFVDYRIQPGFLYTGFLNAKKSLEKPMCLGRTCTGCGSCTPEQRSVLEAHTIIPPSLQDCRELADILREKAQARPVYLTVTIPETLKYAHTETKRSYVLKKLVQVLDNHAVMTVRDILFDGKPFEHRLPHWFGYTVYAVYPFTNKNRTDLLIKMKKAGFPVSDSIVMPVKIVAELSNNTLTDRRQLEKTAEGLLNEMHLPYILSRTDEVTRLIIAPKALKKGIVTDCFIENGRIHLSGSCKLNLAGIEKAGFTAEMHIG